MIDQTCIFVVEKIITGNLFYTALLSDSRWIDAWTIRCPWLTVVNTLANAKFALQTTWWGWLRAWPMRRVGKRFFS